MLSSNGGNITLRAEDDLELVGYALWAVASGAGSSIFVVEVNAQ